MKIMMFHGKPHLVISEDIDGYRISRPVYLDRIAIRVILKNIETLEKFESTDWVILREYCKKSSVDFE